ncbi:MAG: alpha/beta hydrolase [Gammaproteobacteria bacterium]|nr:alpha/beta hydrolase [Gammaproteobacteria bacterium]
MNALAILPTAFVRTSGQGDNIVCLHSSLGSSRQWFGLMDRLDDSYRVTATDLYGYGNSPKWHLDRAFTLDDDVDFFAPVLAAMSGPIHLVGHSYGAAVTLKAAQRYATKIASLTLYEPVVFTALFASAETQQVASEVTQFSMEIEREYRTGRFASATRKFIEYWSGPGSWDQLRPQQQTEMSDKIDTVLENFKAIFAEQNTLTSLENLHVPALCLYGEKSPRPTQVISQILSNILPDAELLQMPQMGHMGPITHRETVNDEIEAFIRGQVSTFDEHEVPFAA